MTSKHNYASQELIETAAFDQEYYCRVKMKSGTLDRSVVKVPMVSLSEEEAHASQTLENLPAFPTGSGMANPVHETLCDL